MSTMIVPSKELLKLSNEEKECLQFLQKNHETLVPFYYSSLKNGRKGILHKLASSLFREDIIQIYSKSITMKKIGSVFMMGLEDITSCREVLLRQFQKQNLREDISYRLYFLEHGLLLFPVERKFAFRRILLTDDILFIRKDRVQKVETASELLSILGDKLQGEAHQLQKELENGTANYILALSYFEHWKQDIQDEAKQVNAGTLIEYANSKKRLNPSWSISQFFEQLSTEGHQLHPGAKTKTGLKPKDVFQYSPEFHQSQWIRFVAVKRAHMKQIEVQPNYIAVAFPTIYSLYQIQMKKKRYRPEDYLLLPIHDWQYKNALSNIYSKEMKDDVIILLDELKLEGTASSSFRTIWPKDIEAPSLKLAVNSQMTSTVRSISPQTAMNSLKFTKMMKVILDKEPSLKKFNPINEVAGYCFRSNHVDQMRNLTVVLRESVENKLEPNEIAIAGCSLYSPSPLTGKPLIYEVVEEYGCHHQYSKQEAAVHFLKSYLSVVIPGYLTLLVKYGVTLEGHLQNSVPVFKHGKLVRFYFRDWGGARIYKDRLHRQGISVDFYPESVSVTDDEKELLNKAYYTVFQNHLGEIIIHLCQYSGIPEQKYWEEVKKACDESFRSLQTQGLYSAIKDANFLYQPLVDHKALTKMRLYPNSGYSYSSVPNPLYEKEWDHE